MEFRTLRAFIEVVREGGFSRAAEKVFATQSTISKAVKQLEEELGFTLLDRSGRTSRLTAAGEIVYRRGQALLADRDDLLAELDELRGLKRGVLRLGLPPIGSSMLFAPLFATFRSCYPGVEIKLVEQGSKSLEELLRVGELDLAGLLLPVSEEFEWLEARREPLEALIAADHPFASRESLTAFELAQLPFILFESGFALNPVILAACGRSGFTPTVAARTSQIDFMVELVAAKLGVGFLPRMLARSLKHPGVRSLDISVAGMDWHFALAWRRGGYLSDAARAWLALAGEARRETTEPSH